MQADINHLRAIAHLAARDFGSLFPFLFGDQLLESARADYVRPLADEEGSIRIISFDKLDAGVIRAVRGRGNCPRLAALHHFRERADMRGRRAAAAADHVQPAMLDEARKLGRERLGRFAVGAVFARQPGVRIAGNTRRGDFAERANVIGHEFGPGGAIQADRKQILPRDRGPERVGRLSGEHRAHGLDRAGNHHRNIDAEFLFHARDRQQGRLHVARVLASLDQQNIGAALDERLRLLVEILAKRVERDPAGDGNRFSRGPHRTGDKSRAIRGGEFIGRAPGQLRRRSIQRRRFFFEVIFGENDARAAERIGFDDVRAGFEIGAMNIENHVGPRAHQHFIAAFERRAAEIRG